MTTTIWKYELPEPGKAYLADIPGPVRPVHVGLDPSGIACLWAEVTPAEPTRQMCLSVWGTGHPIDVYEDADFARWHTGSWVDEGYVWHVLVHLGRPARSGAVEAAIHIASTTQPDVLRQIAENLRYQAMR